MKTGEKAEHDAAIERLAEQYRGQGYDVVAEPQVEQLPAFLRPHRPDLIASKDGVSYVIEVILPGAARRAGPWQQVARLTEQQPGWHFRLVILPDSSGEAREIVLPTRDDLLRQLGEVEQLMVAGHGHAALLIAWSLLEASARHQLLPQQEFSAIAESRFLIKSLAHLGHIDDAELFRLRSVMEKRNSLAHGFLRRDVDDADVRFVLDIAKRLITAEPEEFAA